MKSSNRSMILVSFVLALVIIGSYASLSYLYLQECIARIKLQEQAFIVSYATKLTHQNQTLQALKQSIFGTQESFEYQMALLDPNDQVLYSTYTKLPPTPLVETTSFDKETITYNTMSHFNDIGTVKIILSKKLNYTAVHQKTMLLLSGLIGLFLIGWLLIYVFLRNICLFFSLKYNTFFRDAIHEIRTPLGVIQINLEFLENSFENSMPLKRAQGGLKNLTSIYESLEYYIKKKKVTYKKESINVSKFLQDRIDFFQVLADIKSMSIQKDIQEHCTVFMSRIELQRLLDNNLSNAIKYSKEHTTLYIKLMTEERFILLSFSNRGEQIADITKIFQKYYRGNDLKGGFGLGLSIVKYICELYAIKIDVVSLPNGESTFSYKIPYKPVTHV